MRLGVHNLRVFGCSCFYQVPEQRRDKLDSRAEREIFISYSLVTKGYSGGDWGGHLDDFKITFGNLFTLGYGIFTWTQRSKKQQHNPQQKLSILLLPLL